MILQGLCTCFEWHCRIYIYVVYDTAGFMWCSNTWRVYVGAVCDRRIYINAVYDSEWFMFMLYMTLQDFCRDCMWHFTVYLLQECYCAATLFWHEGTNLTNSTLNPLSGKEYRIDADSDITLSPACFQHFLLWQVFSEDERLLHCYAGLLTSDVSVERTIVIFEDRIIAIGITDSWGWRRCFPLNHRL